MDGQTLPDPAGRRFLSVPRVTMAGMVDGDAAVVWDKALLDYDMGDHPLNPVRVELTMALARELGVLDRPGVRMLTPQPADDAALTRIHRATRHVGKFPRHRGPSADRVVELVGLRRQLQSAVAAEAYEEAARLRDLLRQKEATDEPG